MPDRREPARPRAMSAAPSPCLRRRAATRTPADPMPTTRRPTTGARRGAAGPAGPGADRRRRGPARGRASRWLAELGIDGHGAGRRRQGPRPRCRARAFSHPGSREIDACSSRAIPCSISCSGSATRRTASPSARIARSAPRRSAPIRSTRSPASARRASAALLEAFRLGQGRVARQRRGPQGRRQASPRRWRRRSTTSFTRRGERGQAKTPRPLQPTVQSAINRRPDNSRYCQCRGSWQIRRPGWSTRSPSSQRSARVRRWYRRRYSRQCRPRHNRRCCR